MRFRYRILIYAQNHSLKVIEKEANKQLKLKKENEYIAENKLQEKSTNIEQEKPISGTTKSVTFATEKTYIDPQPDEINELNLNNNQNINNNNHYNNNDANYNKNVEYKLKSSLKVRKSKYKFESEYDEASGLPPPAVKMVIARKPALAVEPQRKTSLKRAQSENSAQNNNNNNNNKNSTIVTNDFKCLRSNDMRYSDYAVTSSTTTNQNNVATTGNKRADNNKLHKFDKTQLKLTIPTTTAAANVTKPATAPPTVVVSIPRFPLSSYDKDELFENVTFAQLKTASSKKSATTTTKAETTTSVNTTTSTKAQNNLPRLKIELNSLKTKITLPKSETFEQNFEDIELGLKTHKVRKRSYEEMEPTTEQVDLETYAKNIGLKPIDSSVLKYSPNASPHSSTSSSSNSSALTNFEMSSDLEYTSTAHKKRKKKHHSKEGNGGSKKRKLHAEISSQNADESLKMKVKITAAHSHRGHHKVTTPQSSASIAEEKVTGPATNGLECTTSPQNNAPANEKEAKAQTDPQVTKSLDSTQSAVESVQKVENSETMEAKDVKSPLIPASPPLPPSLFKTVPPLALSQDASLLPPAARKAKMGVPSTSATTTTVAPSSIALAKPLVKSPSPKPASPKPVSPKPASHKLTSPITTTASTVALTQQQKPFAVPALPTRLALPAGNTLAVRKFTATMPSTIASAAHKQQQQLQKLQKNTFKQLEQERQAAKIDTFTHNFKLPKLPHFKSSSSTAMPTFDNRALYAPLTSAAMNDFTKRLASSGSNTVTITSRPKIMGTNKSAGNFQMCDLTALQQLQQRQNNQIKASLEFMRAANPGKTAMSFGTSAALTVKTNGNREEGNRTTLMGPPLSTIMKSPRKLTNSKTPQNSPSALSFNMSSHVPLSIASLAAVAAGAGNVSSPTTLPHGVRSPPLPLTTALAAAKNKSPYRQTPPALINFCNPVNMLFSHGDMQRPMMRDLKYPNNNAVSKTSALDLSGNSAKNPACNTLEAALNKIKQNIMSCTVTTAERELAGTTTTTTTAATDNNLKSLPTFAKEREKLLSMFEKSKLQQSPAAMVRPQNASVRHIPNPSALAFRNQPTTNVPTTTTAVTAAKSTIKSPHSVSSPPMSKTVALNVATSNANTNTNNQSPPLRATKKPTTIDQVAANLNIRAAAAALSAANTSTTVKSSEESGKVIKTADTTTTSNGDAASSTTTPTSSTGLQAEQQETSKSAENDADIMKTTAAAITTTMPKSAPNFKSIAENSCSSPGPTAVTSIKLEKIAVE